MVTALRLPLAINQVEVNSRSGNQWLRGRKVEPGSKLYNSQTKVMEEQREKDILVTRAAHDTGKCFGAVRPTDRLFPDQSGLQYCRHSHYHRHSTLEPVGNLHSSRARFLGCQ